MIIGKKDLDIEILFFLCFFENWGGFKKTRIEYNSVSTAKHLEDRMETFFRYFDLGNNVQDEAEKERNQQKYMVHLEEVKKGIISLIFENKI